MISRTRIIITSVMLCHWFVGTTLVTSQLRPAVEEVQAVPTAPSALDHEDVTIRSLEQEKDAASAERPTRRPPGGRSSDRPPDAPQIAMWADVPSPRAADAAPHIDSAPPPKGD